jgi:hypothetical protein
MKTNIKKLIGMAVLGLVLLSQSIPTWAGSTSLFDVQVGATYGRGPMTWARYSPDDQQYIGCSFTHPSLGLMVNCLARDKTGQSFACWSNEAKFVDAVKAITDSSILYFISNPGSSACVYLEVTNASTSLR